jgi:glycosyltransferase involved in cell wall biosynthesis
MLAPTFPWAAWREIGSHDAVQVHTPLMEGALVGAFCRARRRPLVMTHQGDLVMPQGAVNQLVQRVGTGLLRATGRLSSTITTHNEDYALSSRFLRPFGRKVVPIYPPVHVPPPDLDAAAAWRRELRLQDRLLVGFAGRFVEEKGFDYLFRALPSLIELEPRAHLVFAGEQDVVYEPFWERCRDLIEPHKERFTALGVLHDRQRLADFYAMCDVFVLPSRTDSFAAVQVEAMLAGTPVVATDIPGARTIVRATGMGLLVNPRDPAALARGLAGVLGDPSGYTKTRAEIESVFDEDASIDSYERLLLNLIREGRGR